MLKSDIKLNNPDRFLKPSNLTMDKIKAAQKRATARLEKSLLKFTYRFPATAKIATNKYDFVDKVTWVTSLGTGMYWLAYELTGNEAFKNSAQEHGKVCHFWAIDRKNLDDHDTGFKYSPSSVAEYKITGNPLAKEAALIAANALYGHFCQDNKFIIRVGTGSKNDGYWAYRALVDSMLNIPLFFWAYEETGEHRYLEAATEHYRTTAKYLIREDGSSYHHYQFNPVTREPLYGCTHQGNRDESTWSRGHAWLVYGYPIAYSHTHNDEILPIAKSVTNYFLNNLPGDLVPYWDFDFNDGSLEPRDSSASAIVVCGLLELCKHLDKDSCEYKLYYNAALLLMEALIDKCEITDDRFDGLIAHVTGAKPQNADVDTIATYGDYFYYEALMRFTNPDWNMYW